MTTLEPKGYRDRLSMIDEHGHRIPLFPAEVTGFWRTRRTLVQLILIVIFLALPWIPINGAPAILIDLTRRQFAFFGLKFWAHDSPLIFFVLGFLTVGLALMTAVLGRIWCGWACPQTVFLDGVIRRIERWTEGTYQKRRELNEGPLTFSKFFRKTIKWILFVGFVGVLTHSFLAYFVGADRLLEMMQQDPRKNWGDFVFIVATSGLLLFDLAWFREQFCLIVCPYGRFQSVLMDRHTITVQYDHERGEPRKGSPEAAAGKQGDCVACNRCVRVCPTGIDIRNGIQMECVSCTACIDACDEIMTKVKKPTGLIRYKSSVPAGQKTHVIRPRVALYSALFLFMCSGLVWAITHRKDVDMAILRALDLPFYEKTLPQGEVMIVNSYRLHVHNQTDAPVEVNLQWQDPTIMTTAALEIPQGLMKIKPNEFRMIPFVVALPKSEIQAAGGNKILKFRMLDQNFEVNFVGPQP